MPENIPLLRPSAGQHAVVPVADDARLEFTFHQGDADLSRNGQDLVLSFDDGATLTLQAFYDTFGANAQPPTFIMEGHELPGEQFLAALQDPDLLPAAGPLAGNAEGGGRYEDAVLHGVDGVSGLDKLGFDGWGRGAEAAEAAERYAGVPYREMPGGSFSLEGNSYDMNGVFMASGMHEDWRPRQHEGDYDAKAYGRLDFSFTPTGTTVVDGIHLSGFDAGAIIVVGTPVFDAEGNLINGIPVTGPDQVFHFTQSNFNHDGVYVMPPPNSDRDMTISVTLDLRAASSGMTGAIHGVFTIAVDAVADKPAVESAGFDDTGHVGQVDEARDTRKEFDDRGHHIVEQRADGTEQVSVAIPFHATVTFGDYLDGSEHHFALIEVPSAPEGALWACPEASGTITGPDGKEYFRIPVDNADIAAGKGEIAVDVHLTVTGDAATVTDTDMTLSVGAMAEEHPDDQELALDNNVAFDFREGGADLHLDVVDGGLKITAGWASEGNNDAKHLGTASDGYAYEGAEAGATGNAAGGAANTGAPILIEAGVDSRGGAEVITSVTFGYDAGEGHIWQFDGTQWTDLDPDGTGRVTLDGLSTGRLEGLAYRPNEGSFSDNDVDIRYTVNVRNEAGVKGGYSGSFIVAVDAVADLSAEVVSSAQGDHSNQWYVDQAKETIKDANAHDAKGWETDSFKLDYSHVRYGFTVHVSTTFPDTDGSERHYALVEHQPGWSLGDLPPGYTYAGEYTGSDGKTYFKIEVDDPTRSTADLDVPLSKTGIAGDVNVPLKTGSYVEEAAGSGREYDLGNNAAERTDGTVAELRADVINSTLTVKTGWASEGNNDAKHLGTASDGYAYEGAEAGATGNAAGGAANTGAPITFSLTGGQGAGEFMSQVTFTFDGERGTLTYSGPGVLSGPVANPDGTVTYTFSGMNSSSISGVRFVPAAEGPQSFNDADVSLKYEVTISSPSASTSHTFSGTSTIIIDAVADRPTDLRIPGQDGISYSRVDEDGKPADHDAATWGSEIGFTVGASFHDIQDGSETHYVLVEARPGWSGDYNTVVIDKVAYFVIDVNDAVHAALREGGSYDQGGVKAEIVYDGYGVPHANVTVDVNLTLPDRPADGKIPAYMQGDGQVGLASGGLAVEGEIRWSKPDADGHSTGTVQAGGTDREIDPGNNAALALDDVMVNVHVVTSVPKVSITDNTIYENLAPDAHKGDETASGGAKITVHGLAAGEHAEIAFTFDFVKGGAQEGVFDSAPGKHADDVMRLELVDGKGSVIGTYPITWDGHAWTCAMTVEGGNDATFVFKPGYNYNSTDLGINYEMTVTDPASGDQMSWKTGDNPGLPGLTVIVDAVAQQPIIDDASAAYARTGGTDAFVRGGAVDIGARVEYRDFEDGSEKHFVLVEAKAGWQAPDSPLTILDGGGNPHDVAVTWTMQMIDGKMYYKAEVDNRHIQDWGQRGEYGNGLLDMHISMRSPSGAGSHADFTVGGGAWESKELADGELRWDNNSSFVFGTVGVDFSSVGSFGIQPGGWAYENDTPDAHTGSDAAAGGIRLTVTASHPGDVITDFKFDTYGGDNGVLAKGGVVYFQDPRSGGLIELNPDGSIPGNPPLHGGEQFVFIPNHNYSDADVNLKFSGTITDPRSGDTKAPEGQATVLIDAVAQKPGEVGTDESAVTVDWLNGDREFTLTVSACFEDYGDTSESHYILVQQAANMRVEGAEGVFSVKNADGGYTNYWKVPVSNEYLQEHGGKVENYPIKVVAEGVVSGHVPDGVKVGALAVESALSGSELTFHNNYAFTEGGTVDITWHLGSGPGEIWMGAGYENNRPHAHLGDETPGDGAPVYFGGDVGSVDMAWNPDQGYFTDAAGNEYKGGSAHLDSAVGPFHFVPTGCGDEDANVRYTAYDADGKPLHSGSAVIIIDAVAGKPSGLEDEARVDYGTAPGGSPWTAAGKPDGHGNNGEATIRIRGEFADNGGSEKHYALIEAQPGYTVSGGELIFLDGKAYYQVEMAKNPDGGYILDEHGKQYADVAVTITHPENIGKGGHDLGTGLMAVEQESGRAGNLELTTDNNVSWTLGGNAHIDVSFVDSSVSLSVPSGVHERGEGDAGFEVLLSATLGEGDSFEGMTVSASGKGAFSVEDPQGVGGWEIVDGTLVISNFDAIGAIKVSFTPETHSGADISFSWSADFSDARSGDQAGYGGAPYVIVDAVANAPDIVESFAVSDSGNLAAQAGEGASVTTKLHFDDMSGREVHYAVLEQGAFTGAQSNVWLCDRVSVNGVEYPIITLFSQSGKPYYAVEIPNDAAPGGDAEVTWHVTAPNAKQDVEAVLKMGGVSVEPGAGAGADQELTLDNNWSEHIQNVPVKIGVFDTAAVGFGKDGDLVVDDANGVALHLQAPAAGANEIITRITLNFAQEGAGEGDTIGAVWYQGTAYEVVAGEDGEGRVTIEFGDRGYDPGAEFRFTATDAAGNSFYNSNPIQVAADSTVKDVHLGEERTFTDQQVFTVQAAPGAPEDVAGNGGAFASGGLVDAHVHADADTGLLGPQEHHAAADVTAYAVPAPSFQDYRIGGNTEAGGRLDAAAQDGHALHGIAEADRLHFADLISPGDEPLDLALAFLQDSHGHGNNTTWHEDARGHGGTSAAMDGSGAGLQRLDIGQPLQDGAMDQNAVTHMLQEIIKVGGDA